MRRLIFLFFILIWFATASTAQTIAGIRIGEPPKVLDKLNLKPTARETQGSKETVKYRLADGDDLSATSDSHTNRILYIERDWCREPRNTTTDFPGFTFGVTTLEDIRKANRSNGFTYQSNAMGQAGGELFTFNAYRLKDATGLVVVFVTTLNIAEVRRKLGNKDSSPEDIPKNLRLDALILAEESYLDEIWGIQKAYDKENKPIGWGEIQSEAK